MDFDDQKEFDDPQVFDPKRISIGSMDFDNPRVYGDTFSPSSSMVLLLLIVLERNTANWGLTLLFHITHIIKELAYFFGRWQSY